jgi:hypothetical protein
MPGRLFLAGVAHKAVDGRITYEQLPEQEWSVLLREAHPGYITWAEYQENLQRLRESAQSHGTPEASQPGARRTSALTRVGAVWRVRAPHDGAVSQPIQRSHSGLRLPT